MFADKDFDGEPVVVYDPEPGENMGGEEQGSDTGQTEGGGNQESGGNEGVDIGGNINDPPPKYVVKGVKVEVLAERVQYLDANGKLITASLTEYTTECVTRQCATLGDFLKKWSAADKKKAILDELTEQGVMFEDLQQAVSKKLGYELDPFDLICHVVYGQPPLSRKQRAEQVKANNYFAKYQGAAKQVLEALLDKYADTGIEHIEDSKILTLAPFTKIGSPIEIVGEFGGKQKYQTALKELEDELYKTA